MRHPPSIEDVNRAQHIGGSSEVLHLKDLDCTKVVQFGGIFLWLNEGGGTGKGSSQRFIRQIEYHRINSSARRIWEPGLDGQ